MLAAYGFSPKAIGELADVGKALERVADKEFTGSVTGPFAIVWDMVQGVFTLNPLTLGRLGGQVLLPRAIAKATLTSEGRAALMEVSGKWTYSRQGLAAVTYLIGLNVEQQVQESARDFQAPTGQQLGVQ